MLEINKIHNGDCLELMKQIEDKCVDMILCDLPYGTTACKWDTIISFDKLWEQYNRIIKDNGAIVLTASQPFTSALIMSNIKMFKYNYTWVKSKKTGFSFCKFQPLRQTEDVIIFYKNFPIYNPQNIIKLKNPIKKFRKKGGQGESLKPEGLCDKEYFQTHKNYPTNVLIINSENKSMHPTQKPIELGKYLIRTYTNERDLVLDNTCGVGSFPLSAKLENRNFIGIELNKKYCEIAIKRINEVKTQ